MLKRILFVDDEDFILSTIKRLFRKSEYEILYAGSGEEGLNILADNDVSIIISDMRMPLMDGAEFLEKAKKIRPDAIKMILSGHAEIDTILNSINRGNIWRFITKPWDNNDLKIAIHNAMELYTGRIREKDLLLSLKKKTRELDQLNKDLEIKVEERTWLLNERSQILNMLLENFELEDILLRVCTTLSKLLAGKSVYVVFNDNIYTNLPDIPEYIRYNDGVHNNVYQHKITKNKETLGSLLIDNMSDDDHKLLLKAKGMISMISIILFYKKVIDDSSSILDNINKYMESI